MATIIIRLVSPSQQAAAVIAVMRIHFNQKFSSSICKYLFLNEDLYNCLGWCHNDNLEITARV